MFTLGFHHRNRGRQVRRVLIERAQEHEDVVGSRAIDEIAIGHRLVVVRRQDQEFSALAAVGSWLTVGSAGSTLMTRFHTTRHFRRTGRIGFSRAMSFAGYSTRRRCLHGRRSGQGRRIYCRCERDRSQCQPLPWQGAGRDWVGRARKANTRERVSCCSRTRGRAQS